MASHSGNSQEGDYCENCYLFVAGLSEGTPTLLFLEPAANTTSASFVLKRACPIAGISLFTPSHYSSLQRPFSTDKDSLLCGNLSETLGKIRRVSALTLDEFMEQPRVDSRKYERHDQDIFREKDLLRWFLPGEGVVLQDILPLLSQLSRTDYRLATFHDKDTEDLLNNSHWRKFLEMYRNFLERKCPELQPCLLEDPGDFPGQWVSFQCSKERWSKIVDQDASPNIILNANYKDLVPERRPGQEFVHFTRHEYLDEVTVKIDLPLWCDCLLDLDIVRDLGILRGLEIDVTKNLRQSRLEDRDMCIHELPEVATDELGLLWKHETVTIV